MLPEDAMRRLRGDAEMKSTAKLNIINYYNYCYWHKVFLEMGGLGSWKLDSFRGTPSAIVLAITFGTSLQKYWYFTASFFSKCGWLCFIGGKLPN